MRAHHLQLMSRARQSGPENSLNLAHLTAEFNALLSKGVPLSLAELKRYQQLVILMEKTGISGKTQGDIIMGLRRGPESPVDSGQQGDSI